MKFPNANCCIKVSHWSGQFCLPEKAKVTQVRLSEILQQVFVRILQAVKAALLLTHTRHHVPVPPPPRKKKTRPLSAPPDVLLGGALQVDKTKEQPAPAEKKSHNKKKIATVKSIKAICCTE